MSESEPRPAPHELVELLTATRKDWQPRDVRQVLTHITAIGWPWTQILRLFTRVAAEPDSKPGDVVGAWRPPNQRTGTAPNEEYRAVKQALTQPDQ